MEVVVSGVSAGRNKEGSSKGGTEGPAGPDHAVFRCFGDVQCPIGLAGEKGREEQNNPGKPLRPRKARACPITFW